MNWLEDISRREFLRYTIGGGVGLFLGLGQVSCKLVQEEPPYVSIEELLLDSRKYRNKVIQTSGFLEYVGEERYTFDRDDIDVWEGLYFPKVPKEPKKVFLPSYRLHTQPDKASPSFLVTEEKAIHLSVEDGVKAGTFYQDKMQLIGIICRDSKRKYFLKVLDSLTVHE